MGLARMVRLHDNAAALKALQTAVQLDPASAALAVCWPVFISNKTTPPRPPPSYAGPSS